MIIRMYMPPTLPTRTNTDTHADTRTCTQHYTQYAERAMRGGARRLHQLQWRTAKRHLIIAPLVTKALMKYGVMKVSSVHQLHHQ